MFAISRRTLMSSSLVALTAGCASQRAAQGGAPAPRGAPAAIGAFGVDLTARDVGVRAGDDFFRHMNGVWLDNTEIPADRTRWGAFDMLIEKCDRDVRGLLDEVAHRGGSPGSEEQKIADFYNAFLDVDAINAAGMAPAQAHLAAIAAARTNSDIVRLMTRADFPVATPVAIFIASDDRNPDRFVAHLTHGGLSLPDREYYLDASAEFSRIREEFGSHVASMLELSGVRDGAAKAARIVELETEIARLHWPIAERREREDVYNFMSRSEVSALAPDFPWDAMFEAAEVPDVREIIVQELSAIGPLARLVLQTPVATWRDYLTYHLLTNAASVLPSAIDATNFAFYGSSLNGQPVQRERWKRGVAAVNGALGKAVGKLYVERHFSVEAKSQMLALVENLRRAYGERIDALAWMSAETKRAAREKLATFAPKIGYPDSWQDYSTLEVRAADAFGNYIRSGVYAWRRSVARLGRPVDKSEWLYMDPQEVNAYYNASFNEIVFPAAILQPPFFDLNADPAVNYGAIGAVIGHEMGHGFDDQGAKSDARGVLRDWWSETDVRAFGDLVARLAAQYDAYEPLPGLHINGRLTSGENIGDNGGLQVAFHAYKLALGGDEAPVLEGTTGDQRFFMGWAQVWRTKQRDQSLRNQIMSDSHSPAAYRCNGPVRNMAAWSEAFDVGPEDDLYLPPAERVSIW